MTDRWSLALEVAGSRLFSCTHFDCCVTVLSELILLLVQEPTSAAAPPVRMLVTASVNHSATGASVLMDSQETSAIKVTNCDSVCVSVCVSVCACLWECVSVCVCVCQCVCV